MLHSCHQGSPFLSGSAKSRLRKFRPQRSPEADFQLQSLWKGHGRPGFVLREEMEIEQFELELYTASPLTCCPAGSHLWYGSLVVYTSKICKYFALLSTIAYHCLVSHTASH